jgi:hypothetical protein
MFLIKIIVVNPLVELTERITSPQDEEKIKLFLKDINRIE